MKIKLNRKHIHYGVFQVELTSGESFWCSQFFIYQVKNPLNSSFRYRALDGSGEYRIQLDKIKIVHIDQTFEPLKEIRAPHE